MSTLFSAITQAEYLDILSSARNCAETEFLVTPPHSMNPPVLLRESGKSLKSRLERKGFTVNTSSRDGKIRWVVEKKTLDKTGKPV